MNKIDRRSALGIVLATVSAAMMKPATAQTTGYKDATPWPGVVVRAYDGETPSIKSSQTDPLFYPLKSGRRRLRDVASRTMNREN